MEKKISVLMGIYNCATTLPEAIDCILAQTVENWELILCDDGSADDTYAVAQEYAQKHPGKIILLKNEKNMGLNYTLNHCLSAATGGGRSQHRCPLPARSGKRHRKVADPYR